MSDPASITSHVTSADREQRHGHPGRIVWLTGLSGAGKSTLAMALERRLFDAGRNVYVLAGEDDDEWVRVLGAASAKSPASWPKPGYW